MKNIKITEEAVSAAEEAAAAFLADLKKSIKEKGYHPKQVLIGMYVCIGESIICIRFCTI